jgi:hypothetical protein
MEDLFLPVFQELPVYFLFLWTLLRLHSLQNFVVVLDSRSSQWIQLQISPYSKKLFSLIFCSQKTSGSWETPLLKV